MNTTPKNSSKSAAIVVAGDVCLDVVGIPIPPPIMAEEKADNWRQTGETRTHYLLGGALLLEHWVRAAAGNHRVSGPIPCLPKALSCGSSTETPLNAEQFLATAERLTRDEVVHSLIELGFFHSTAELKEREKERDQVRVLATHGYSGPKNGDPSLTILPPSSESSPRIIVLDDTGNRFRRTPAQWPAAITGKQTQEESLVVYKLHRPLPTRTNKSKDGKPDTSSHELDHPIWNEVTRNFPERMIVVVSVDDLRDKDALISRGLSWERTALDLVWQLLNVDAFAELRDCRHLIVRFGLNGAVYWHHNEPEKSDDPRYHAWLIYDPNGIEGTGEQQLEGRMVGYGSAFTAALTGNLAAAATCNLSPIKSSNGAKKPADCIESGIKAGLLASRRLLQLGFGPTTQENPAYPAEKLFEIASEKDPFFACESIPIIPGTIVPDRGYWRLLDSIFEGKTTLLHKAVELTATGAKPRDEKEQEKQAADLLKRVPIAVFAKALRTHDRREIENYRALYSLMLDYTNHDTPPRPLSIAVFGPPGAGKSFGVKQVAKALSQLGGPRPIETLTFNLSQYETPQQLADAFHLVRDLVLKGKIPLVFFDEFDSALAGVRLGWLRYFLAPMQDAEFLDNGTPHPIGQAIFIFAGGTCATYAEFAAPFLVPYSEEKNAQRARDAFKAAKGPDFLSRLRGTLDIPGLDLHSSFDPYGPVEALPCEAAILLRRAGILAHQLGEKAPQLRNSAKTLQVSPVVLRSLLHLPKFVHGNRSFEALLDMSSLAGSAKFTPSLLPSPSHSELHADSTQMSQLLRTEYPFPHDDGETIAKAIHDSYVAERKRDPKHDPNDLSLKPWDSPTNNPGDGLSDHLKESNREQADHIAVKLRMASLWYRKRIPGVAAGADVSQLDATVERLAIAEHDRWVAEKRRKGWIAAPCQERKCRKDELRLHNCIFKWEQLTKEQQQLDIDTVRQIPDHLAKAGYEIVNL